MPDFEYQFEVNAPLEKVLAFHGDSRALKRLTPLPLIVSVHEFGEMREGMIARFTLWVGPLPIHWTARHQEVGRRGFTDVQVAGPLKSWHHRHTFLELSPNCTRIVEQVRYQHDSGWRGLFSRLLFPRPGLWLLFSYRRLVTRRALAPGGDPA